MSSLHTRAIVCLVCLLGLSALSHGATLQLPRTGQSVCYDGSGTVMSCAGSGQDGAWQAGKPWSSPRFADNGNGTVTDAVTGLVWLKNANCTDTVNGLGGGALSWSESLVWSSGLAGGACGLTDGSVAGQWRLPNRVELTSILDAAHVNPALPSGHPFTAVQAGSYWSSSSDASDTASAWSAHLGNGSVGAVAKTAGNHVWTVRGQ